MHYFCFFFNGWGGGAFPPPRIGQQKGLDGTTKAIILEIPGNHVSFFFLLFGTCELIRESNLTPGCVECLRTDPGSFYENLSSGKDKRHIRNIRCYVILVFMNELSGKHRT